jgi:hypothetical protein
MHAEGKKATQTSKAADYEREGVLYLNSLSKAITCTQFEIRHLFKIEASSFFVMLKLVHHEGSHMVSRFRSTYFRINTEDMA